MFEEMITELRDSWEVHSMSSMTKLSQPLEAVRQSITSALEQLNSNISETERSLEQEFVRQFQICVTKTRMAASRAIGVVGLLPLRVQIRESLLKKSGSNILKFFSDEAQDEYRERLILLLDPNVMRTMLGRIANAVAATTAADTAAIEKILQDLRSLPRSWNIRDNIEWLVFEFEQQLKIRPEQYALARHLIDNPGDVVQLNLGSAKLVLFCQW